MYIFWSASNIDKTFRLENCIDFGFCTQTDYNYETDDGMEVNAENIARSKDMYSSRPDRTPNRQNLL